MNAVASRSPWSAEGRRLFLLGFGTLFLELALIRFLAGSVANLGHFPNFVLLSVFLGMGLGFSLHQRASDDASRRVFQAALFLLLALAAFVLLANPQTPLRTTNDTTADGEIFFGSSIGGANAWWSFIGLFAFVVVVFAFISQRTAKLFRQFAPLTAYTLDILGSCAGILAFMLISWLSAPAWTWFVCFAALCVICLDDAGRWRWLPLAPGLLIALTAVQLDQRSYERYGAPRLETRWSPYQKVSYCPTGAKGFEERAPLMVNGMAHQEIWPASLVIESFYATPHLERRLRGLPPAENVLIIGAGAGNDIVAALVAGVQHVDAVEIDPVIARFGQERNPLHPYGDPRVRLIVDDGRAVLTNATRKYDLIVFALTDSLVKVSSLSQLRLENYLFTVEAMRRAYELLTPTGRLVFYNYYRQLWLIDKLRESIHEAVGQWPTAGADLNARFAVLSVGKEWRPGAPSKTEFAARDLPRDDWPFLYLRGRGVPVFYQKIMGAMFTLLALLGVGLHFGYRSREGENRRALDFTKLAFFLMGAAFLLLETKSVIQFSLLFGATWVNNSLVFLGVLSLVLAANWTARLFGRQTPLWPIFVLLLGSSVLPFLVPLDGLLRVQNVGWRFVMASLSTFSPIFFANLLFSLTFRDQAVPEHIFGWNLLGATLGGVLEYCSLALGYGMLAWIVAGCYVVAFAMLIAARRAAPLQNEQSAVV